MKVRFQSLQSHITVNRFVKDWKYPLYAYILDPQEVTAPKAILCARRVTSRQSLNVSNSTFNFKVVTIFTANTRSEANASHFHIVHNLPSPYPCECCVVCDPND